MSVLGISVNPAAGQPRLYGALVSGTVAAPVLDHEFELRATDAAASEQAVDLARLLLAKLPGLTFQDAVVRTAGASPVARRNKAQFSRAHAEGAILFVLREHLGKPIGTGDPQSFAKLTGEKKDALVVKAKTLSAGKHDAVIAGLSALPPS